MSSSRDNTCVSAPGWGPSSGQCSLYTTMRILIALQSEVTYIEWQRSPEGVQHFLERWGHPRDGDNARSAEIVLKCENFEGKQKSKAV